MTMRIPVFHGATGGRMYALVDDDLPEEALRVIERHDWHVEANGADHRVVAYGRMRGYPSQIMLHRLVMGAKEPTGQVRFRNGDFLDCRRRNLTLSPPVDYRSPEEPDENGLRYRNLTLTLPEFIVEQLDQLAIENRLSRSRQMEQLLHHALRTMEEAVTPREAAK